MAVNTSAGSTSAAPATIPGSNWRIGPCFPEKRRRAGHRMLSSRLELAALRDIGKITSQVPFNAPFVPKPQRPGVIDDPESGNRGQQQAAADHQEHARG